MAVFLCGQPESLDKISKTQRWFVFVIGMIETMLWSGLIFGWPSLVHVLKLQGVYSNLCLQDYTFDGGNKNNISHTTTFSNDDHVDLLPSVATTANETSLNCIGQDEKFALIYTVACVLYSTPGILVGYALHHLGLAFTRVVGGLMVSGGFVLLSFTSAVTPDYLWGAAILVSVGGNTVRMAGLQFANLFPSNRNTAMAIISGIFTPSAGVFMILQKGESSWHHRCWLFAAAASLIVLLTPLIPRHHIPFTLHQEEVKEKEIEKEEEKSTGRVKSKQQHETSIRNSIFSISSLLHAYWLFMNFFGVSLFATHFNSWINLFSKSTEETSQYSSLYGYANILCFFITPIPGITIDLLSRRYKRGKTGLRAEVASLQAMMLPMVVVSCTAFTQMSMLLFRSPWAVYLGLVCLIINRPSCLAVGIPFIRARFPAQHFNRLIGIQGTTMAMLTFLQYPHFTWTQHYYYLTLGLTLGLMSLSLTQPIHLLSTSYLSRVLTPYSSKDMDEENEVYPNLITRTDQDLRQNENGRQD